MLDSHDLSRKTIPNPRLKKWVDLNIDLGQSQDSPEQAEIISQLLPFATSVNIPCCVHDGTPAEVVQAIEQARQYNCVIGAHVGYPDPASHGYDVVSLRPEELEYWLLIQLGAFRQLLNKFALDVTHVRPHGALYLKLVEDEAVAMTMAKTLYSVNPWLTLVGPAGPLLEKIEKEVGLRTAPEFIIGKRYKADGQLLLNRIYEFLPPHAAMEQARQLVVDQVITSQEGKRLSVSYKTLHLSPKLGNAARIAEKMTMNLEQLTPMAVAEAVKSGWLEMIDDHRGVGGEPLLQDV